MKRTFLLSAILAVCLGACEYQDCGLMPEDGDYSGQRLDCSGVACTKNLVSVGFELRDAAGQPVVLDSFVVTDRAGTPIPASYGWGLVSETSGHYTVLTDSWVRGHEGLGAYFLAKGFRGGVKVFDESYKISADCCHISKMSGKDRIIVP